MESKKEVMHTPEPWSYEAGKGYHEGTIVITSHTMSASSPLAHISNICDDAEPDARRIVACVNACKHYTTEDLEDVGENLSGVHADVKARCAELVEQRDELLQALKGLYEMVSDNFHVDGSMMAACGAAYDAIAKCEVQS